MALIGWTPDLKVGVEEIDNDHNHFIEQVNNLADASDDRFPGLFAEAYEHLVNHFAMEEGLMKKYRFFAFIPHKGEHDRVLEEARRIKEKVDAGDLETGRRYIEETVTAWFINHRNSMDSVTGEYIRMARRSEAQGQG